MDEDVLNTSCFVLLFSDEGQLPLLVREGGILHSSEEDAENDFGDSSAQVRSAEVLGIIPESLNQDNLEVSSKIIFKAAARSIDLFQGSC